MDRVFDFSESTGTTRLVLLALADVAGNDGMVTAYARSQTELARKARCSVTSVRRAIEQLEALGEVQVLNTGHGRAQSSYQIVLHPRQLGGAQNEGAPPPSCTLTPAKLAGQPGQVGGAIIPSLPVDTPSLPLTPCVGFADFWDAYAFKADKGRAEKAWIKAIKLVDPQCIVDAARARAEQDARLGYTYIANPATWLNAKGWEDDLAVRARRSRKPGRNDETKANLMNGLAKVQAGETAVAQMKRAGEIGRAREAQLALNEGTNQ